MPSAVQAQLPKTPADLPVVGRSSLAGVSVDFVYDATLDDPITRWGDCLERVVGCATTNPRSLGGCVATLKPCASAAGGPGCCPRRCLDEFAAELAGGRSEDDALASVFLQGSCVQGFRETIDDAAREVAR